MAANIDPKFLKNLGILESYDPDEHWLLLKNRSFYLIERKVAKIAEGALQPKDAITFKTALEFLQDTAPESAISEDIRNRIKGIESKVFGSSPLDLFERRINEIETEFQELRGNEDPWPIFIKLDKLMWEIEKSALLDKNYLVKRIKVIGLAQEIKLEKDKEKREEKIVESIQKKVELLRFLKEMPEKRYVEGGKDVDSFTAGLLLMGEIFETTNKIRIKESLPKLQKAFSDLMDLSLERLTESVSGIKTRDWGDNYYALNRYRNEYLEYIETLKTVTTNFEKAKMISKENLTERHAALDKVRADLLAPKRRPEEK